MNRRLRNALSPLKPKSLIPAFGSLPVSEHRIADVPGISYDMIHHRCGINIREIPRISAMGSNDRSLYINLYSLLCDADFQPWSNSTSFLAPTGYVSHTPFDNDLHWSINPPDYRWETSNTQYQHPSFDCNTPVDTSHFSVCFQDNIRFRSGYISRGDVECIQMLSWRRSCNGNNTLHGRRYTCNSGDS